MCGSLTGYAVQVDLDDDVDEDELFMRQYLLQVRKQAAMRFIF